MGGPSGASPKRTTIFIVVRFLLSLLSQPATNEIQICTALTICHHHRNDDYAKDPNEFDDSQTRSIKPPDTMWTRTTRHRADAPQSRRTSMEHRTHNYESKFILDSFLLCVCTAKILRRLAAIVDLFPWLQLL